VARAAIVCGLALTLAFWAASCTPSARERPRAEAGPEGQLLSVARVYLEVHHPDWVEETYRLPCRILDEGDYWEVRFQLPENMVGGTPVVQIDKITMKVIKAFHEQ
jgi:hypothetical protein